MKWLQKILGRSDVYIENDLYMRRWRLFPNRWPGIRIHHILESDQDRELHDHPFDFVSIILWGGYWELRDDGSCEWRSPGSIIFRRAETLHRLVLPERLQRGRIIRQTTWTFVIRGPYRREWGFRTDNGWVPWHEFTADRYGRGEGAGEFASRSSL